MRSGKRMDIYSGETCMMYYTLLSSSAIHGRLVLLRARPPQTSLDSLQLSLRNHNPVRIPIALTNMHLDMLVIQRLEQLIAHTILRALLTADLLPLLHVVSTRSHSRIRVVDWESIPPPR